MYYHDVWYYFNIWHADDRKLRILPEKYHHRCNGIIYTTTSESGIWAGFSPVVQSVFSANVVAVVFVVAIIMNLILPKDMEVQKLDN